MIRINFVYLYVYTHSMDVKLTLKLNSEVILRAKAYAKKRKKSLSRIIESYLDALTREEASSDEMTPLVKGLSGVIDLPADYDYRKERTAYLGKKHT